MDKSKMLITEITERDKAKTDAALEAIGVSDVTISPETAKMLRIKKAINFLYGQFENIYLQSLPIITIETEEKSIAPLIALEEAMDKMIRESAWDNNSDAFIVRL